MSITYIGDAYSPDYEKHPAGSGFYLTGAVYRDKLDDLKIPYLVENSFLKPILWEEWNGSSFMRPNREALAIRYFDDAAFRFEN